MNKKLNALVTGGTRGIGQAIAKKLIDEGHYVIITGTKLSKKIPSGCDFEQIDFFDENTTKDFIKFLEKQPIDILVNNAGINKIDKFVEIKESDFDEILRINLKIPFLLSQAVIPNMRANNWGRIINISSIFGKVSKKQRASYSASKFGLEGLTKALSAELSEFNILANCVSPGIIETDLTKTILGKEGMSQILNDIPQKRLGSVEEVAELVCWLCGEKNTYITGQNIAVDGGYTIV